MTKTDHLAKARDYIAIAESGDAKIEAYHRGADEMIASGATQAEIASYVGRTDRWVRTVLSWHRKDPSASHPPFGGAQENEARYARADRRKVEDIARDRPEAVAEAITSAPAEAQQKIADEILKAPNTERSLRNVVKRATEPAPTYEPPKAESKLGDAVMRAWEASELLREGEDPPYDAKYRMTTLAEKLERLAIGLRHYLDTGDVDAEFTQLLEEVGADS